MNWYKEAQQINEQDAHNFYYTDIGHYRGPDIEGLQNEAWAWDGEKILTHDDHMSMKSWNSKMYSGRYENKNGKKRVTLSVPLRKELNKIPDALIRDLTQKYGDDIKIYIFSRGWA